MKRLAAFLLLVSAPVAASELRSSYIEAGFYEGEARYRVNFDVLEFRGERNFGSWLLMVNRETISYDNAEDSTFRLGGGYAFNPGLEALRIVPAIGVAHSTVEKGEARDADSGYFVSLGLRAEFNAALHAEIRHRFTNVHAQRNNDQRVDLVYAVTPALSVSASYRDFEGIDAVGGGIRIAF